MYNTRINWKAQNSTKKRLSIFNNFIALRDDRGTNLSIGFSSFGAK